MIDIKNYNFYEFNYNDFIKDWYKFYDWIYWYKLYKKENDKIIVLYINYDKNRINELNIFTKLKNWINIDYYDFYKINYIDWEYKLEKELKHIQKDIEIKDNYKLPYDIYTRIYKKYVAYEYSINRLFDIENTSLYNDNYIDIFNILFDKHYIQRILEKIN
jgi:hypothetical protein